MKNLFRTYILLFVGALGLLSCGVNDPCTGIQCSGQNVTGSMCVAGTCEGLCVAGFDDCNHDLKTDGCEASLQSDVNNCSHCGAKCSTNHITTPGCTGGVCAGTCDPGWSDCNKDKLTDGCETTSDDSVGNCGGCGKPCSGNHITTPACTAGLCTGVCDTGYLDCNSDKLTDGCETTPATDLKNCGGCGLACSTNHITAACTAGACNGVCDMGFTDCNNDKQKDGCETMIVGDASNCGACGTACSNNNIAAPACAMSLCSGACNTGFADCNGNKQTDGCEVNLQTDINNCGACSSKCSGNNIATPACAAGVCNGACSMGYADCDNNKQTNGCETMVLADINNCGGCGMVCSANHVTAACAAGLCSGACAAGFADCNNSKLTDGCETSTTADINNCGACGSKCSANNIATPVCGASVCTGVCNTGFADCDNNKLTNGCEISINTDANNCGACAKVCSANNIAAPSCGAGVCSGTCNTGFADCNSNKQTDGCEINTNTDKNNCGACAKVCSANNIAAPTCGAGVCNGTCNTGYADCNNNKQTDGCEINTNTDNNNCGVCGKVCATGQSCQSGVCTVVDPCLNYGGTQIVINASLRICKTALTWGTWVPANIPAPWTVCDLTSWPKYAPAATPQSFGLGTLWINNGSCLAGYHREVYVSYNMNDASCYNGPNCCFPDTLVQQFAVCLP